LATLAQDYDWASRIKKVMVDIHEIPGGKPGDDRKWLCLPERSHERYRSTKTNTGQLPESMITER